MRYAFLLVMMGFFTLQAQQTETEKFIKQGQALFGHQLYEDAINKFKQAIAFDKKCLEAHYELAYTYLTIKDYDEALYYSRNVLGERNEYWVDALLIYGAVLTQKGKMKAAVREYRKALKDYPQEYLLYYNIADNYRLLKEENKAEQAIIKCLQLNRNHIPSHVLLSSVMKTKGEVLKSMLPLYYAILIEVDEQRKLELLNDLQVRWRVAMVQKPQASKPVSKHSRVSGLAVAESKLNSIARETSVNHPEEPYTFINQTVMLLSMLSEVQTGELDYFDIRYVDFFNRLYRAGHAQSFANFICSAKYNAEILLWLADNQSQFSAFINWMELQQ
ncbi:tetratricopeptide repeat protein [Carboxylicivirga taeanensis]|uniref:tetratricopeptide repeat protein n=1 Tax=Carboxylicivirga taeanensis TaxID=1416875 RepID=UPI003F6E2DE0